MLDLDWWSLRRDGRPGVALRVRQRQPGPPYRLRLEVGVRTAEGTSVVPVAISEQETALDLDTGARPLEVTLDPNHRLLLWRPEYGPRPVP